MCSSFELRRGKTRASQSGSFLLPRLFEQRSTWLVVAVLMSITSPRAQGAATPTTSAATRPAARLTVNNHYRLRPPRPHDRNGRRRHRQRHRIQLQPVWLGYRHGRRPHHRGRIRMGDSQPPGCFQRNGDTTKENTIRRAESRWCSGPSWTYAPATWKVDLAPGTYDVEVGWGDTALNTTNNLTPLPAAVPSRVSAIKCQRGRGCSRRAISWAGVGV